MKTQISQGTPKRPLTDSGLYQQQGRMITDADWNAMTDLERQQRVDAFKNLIGNGIPGVGGLVLEKNETDSEVTINPGRLYADGVPGDFVTADGQAVKIHQQPDCPALTKVPTKGPYLVYADLWDLSYTALESPELLDPALHGADTSTRTRTLVQIKYAPLKTLPASPHDALPKLLTQEARPELRLILHKTVVENDPCDPCAKEMDLDGRVGNYLFRVEIHDVIQSNGDTILTLKWSRDNGAEAHRADDVPPGFDRGDWVWEFYDHNSETTAGLYFPLDAPPVRGQLRAMFEQPKQGLPRTFVRQWDGYAEINLTQQKVLGGRDRGAPLDSNASPGSHGLATLDDDLTLTINTEFIQLVLALKDPEVNEQTIAPAALLPGDYWQAAVRENAHKAGARILGTEERGEPPQGIEHHYLPLQLVDEAGEFATLSGADRRRAAFPPLSRLTASDIGLRPDTCPKLFGKGNASPPLHDVQSALDALCDINAKDIGFTAQDSCDYLKESGPDTVHQALNELCKRDATHIGFDASNSCAYLKGKKPRTVQQAINALCEREAGESCHRVVEPGELEAVLKELVEAEVEHISLCLKPGKHIWPGRPIKAGSIQIIGNSRDSTVLTGEADVPFRLFAKEIDLRAMTLDLDATAELPVERLSLTSVRFQRASPNKRALLQLTGNEKIFGEIRINDCELYQPEANMPTVRFHTFYGSLIIESSRLIGTVEFGVVDLSESELEQISLTEAFVKSLGEHEWGVLSPKEFENQRDRRATVYLRNNTISHWISALYGPYNLSDRPYYIAPAKHFYLDGNTLGNGSSFCAETIQMTNNVLVTLSPEETRLPGLVTISHRLSANGNFSELANQSGIHALANEPYTSVDPMLG